jgi:propionyl-CoA carboxylase beta chain
MDCDRRTVTQEVVTQEALGGADTHNSVSGVAHIARDNDLAALKAARELFDFLPLSNRCNATRCSATF